MADVDASLVEQILDVPKRKRERTYSITPSRIISGLVLKYLNDVRLVMFAWLRFRERRCKSGFSDSAPRHPPRVRPPNQLTRRHLWPRVPLLDGTVFGCRSPSAGAFFGARDCSEECS